MLHSQVCLGHQYLVFVVSCNLLLVTFLFVIFLYLVIFLLQVVFFVGGGFFLLLFVFVGEDW